MTTLKTETITLKTITGNQYRFNIYPVGTKFKPIGAVYFFTKRYKSSDGNYNHTPIYVGETSNLSERFINHHRMPSIERNGANCICILSESNLTKRQAIETGLRQNYNPCCNRQ